MEPNKGLEKLREKANKKLTATEVDYLELPGAIKDADCEKVEVEGGVSRDLGCCNAFEWNKKAAKLFSCGTCHYVTKQPK